MTYNLFLLFLISTRPSLAFDEPFLKGAFSFPKPVLKKNDYWNSGKVYASFDDKNSHPIYQPLSIPKITHELEQEFSDPHIFLMTCEEDIPCHHSASNVPTLDLTSIHIQELKNAIKDIQDYYEAHKNFKQFSYTLQLKINDAQFKLLSIRSENKNYLNEMKQMQKQLFNIQKKNIKNKKCFLRLQLFLFHH